jgi:hypothetical protein
VARFDVCDAAAAATELIRRGAPLRDVWRHSVLQLVDSYQTVLRRAGAGEAATLFSEEPDLTGHEGVDAALAGLAEYLARRDGWRVPAWTALPTRETLHFWFVDDLPGLRAWALRESPAAFRRRGVFIGENALERV